MAGLDSASGRQGALFYAYFISAILMTFAAFRLLFEVSNLGVAYLAASGAVFASVAPFYWRREVGLRLSIGFPTSVNTALVAVVLGFFWSMSSGAFDFTFWLGLLLAGVVRLYGAFAANSAQAAEMKGWPGLPFLVLTYLISPLLMVGLLLLLPSRKPA